MKNLEDKYWCKDGFDSLDIEPQKQEVNLGKIMLNRPLQEPEMEDIKSIKSNFNPPPQSEKRSSKYED